MAFYARQKTCDFLLAFSTFLILIYIGNRPAVLFQSSPFSYASNTMTKIVPGDSSLTSYKSIREFSASIRDKEGKLLKWKERKNLLKEQVRSIKKADTLSEGGKAGLIVLSVLVAIGLLALVAGLACNLSCNGSEGAAALVGIGGTALIIFLLFLVIKGIKKNRKVSEKTPENRN